MKRILYKIVLASILVGLSYFLFGKEERSQKIYKNVRDVFKDNIKIIDPQNRKLPIYCVDRKQKVLGLTFDVAWGNEDMEEILTILKEEQVPATFFVTGEWVEKYPEDVKKIAQLGHELGNHGANHKHMTKLSKEAQKEEIRTLHGQVKDVTGMDMEVFRAPYGDYDEEVVDTVQECGYAMIQWSVDSLDWKEYGKEAMIRQVMEHKNLAPGAILLLHTGTAYTKDALRPLLHQLKEQGYEFLIISKLIYHYNFFINSEGKQYTKKD